jgi:GntR family transcriptional regulator / MocR family aminotransferase
VGYVDVPVQAALARFLEDGLFARHLRKARAAYGERRELVLEAVHGPLSGHLELVPCQAGLHVTTLMRDQSVDDATVVRTVAEQGVVVESLSQYATTGRPRGIVMGYGAADTPSITPGLARLAAVLDSSGRPAGTHRSGATPSTPPLPPR